MARSTSVEWKGRSVLITGATSGIGEAFAERLAAGGANVLATGRNVGALTALRARFPMIATVACDLSGLPGLRMLVAAAVSHFGAGRAAGSLDMLINNAGSMAEVDFLGQADDPAGVTDEQIMQEASANLVAPILLTRHLLPLLRSGRDPVVVMISSGYALLPATRAPTYSATKAGLHSFSLSLRRQLKPAGIRVVEVIPPLVDTPRTKSASGKKMPVATLVELSLRGIGSGRDEILPGQVALLPMLMRIAPGFAANLMARN